MILSSVLTQLLLGLLSWGFGVVGLFHKSPRSRHLCSSLSLGTCCGSLYCCLYAINRWAEIEDISAILDCASAYLFCAGVLLLVTVALNVLIFVHQPTKN